MGSFSCQQALAVLQKGWLREAKCCQDTDTTTCPPFLGVQPSAFTSAVPLERPWSGPGLICVGHHKNTHQKIIVAPKPFVPKERDGRESHTVTRALSGAHSGVCWDGRDGVQGLWLLRVRVSWATMALFPCARSAASLCLQLWPGQDVALQGQSSWAQLFAHIKPEMKEQ